MKYKLVLLSFIVFKIVNAQDVKEISFNEKVKSLDNTIKTLYSIISGPENKDRNWELFKFLFKEDAEIKLTITGSSDNKIRYYLKVDDYINTYGKWLKQNGYYVKEAERIISTFQHMNSVSSTYEYSYSNGDRHRSLNYINLLKENNRWYISNLKWNQELGNPAQLQEYLSQSKK